MSGAAQETEAAVPVTMELAALPARHIVHQVRGMGSLAVTVALALMGRLGRRPRASGASFSVPGRPVEARVPALPRSLVRDFVRHLGGEPEAYADTVPAHLFPQWAFPLAARTLRGLPVSMARMLNAGCRLVIQAPLPAGVPLVARARLESVDDDGRRIVLHQRIATGPASQPEAVVADLYEVVPSVRARAPRPAAEKAPASRRADVVVPAGARELARWALGRRAGLAFAMLTGDFNPVHWVGPYARVLGFSGPILHGFATLARAVEGLERALAAGAPPDRKVRLAMIDARFVRPLVLPAEVGLYLDGARLFVADARGAPAYLAGTFTSSETTR